MAYEPNQVDPVSPTSPATPPPYRQGTSPEEIRRDIDRTRAEMDETVDALQDRLKPRHLFDDVLEAFKNWGGRAQSAKAAGSHATDAAKDVGSAVIDKLKQNPLPAALIGAGITWLMLEGDKRSGRSRSEYRPRKWDVPEYSGSYVDARTGQPYSADYGEESRGGGGGPGAKEKMSAMAGSAKEKAGGMAQSAKETAGGMAQSAKETASSVGSTASEYAGSAREYASSAGETVSEYASAASDQAYRGYRAGKHYVERGIEEYPLAMGAAAMALGVLTGLLLPHTDTEDRLMGERADEVKDRAKETGQDLLDRGKHVAAATASAAQDEAGGGAGTLVDKVKHVAQDVKRAASESAKREGLDPDSLAQKGKQVAERAKDAAKEETQKQKDQSKL